MKRAIFSLIILALSLRAAEPLRPFPQHTKYAGGAIKPNIPQQQLDDATRVFYETWKKKYVVASRTPHQFYIRDDEEGGGAGKQTIAVSEGHGYGMVIVAFMAGHDPQAREIFDGLYRFYRAHPSAINPRLMAWNQITGEKNNPDGGSDAATDGDLDIAYSLLLAGAQWGGGGVIDYRNEARAMIAAIKNDEINRSVWSVKLGDWVSSGEQKMYFGTRPSDFMCDHFRCFRAATGDSDWSRVIDTCYRVVAAIQKNESAATGLLPDFVTGLDKTPRPAKPHFLEGPHDGHYSYNACRVPLRLGIDFILNGEPRAKTALEKINAWLKNATEGDPEKIRAGYTLEGKVIHHGDIAMAFNSCFAVGAMCDAANQKWLDALWKNIVESDSLDDRYYSRTLKMQCLLALSGNWWSPCK